MATSNTYLKVTELDFNDIRDNLKTFLSNQTQFKDYDFEGSAMSVLLDVLSYNTHYNAYYVNMLANEMFLDTAQQRDSVVSRAKELGYVPISSIGPTANINITFTGVESNVSQITVPKNAKFTTNLDDITYTYVTPQAYTLVSDSGTFSGAINIKEGEPLTHSFVHDASNPKRFIIPNKNVDTSSIVVKVQNSTTDTGITEFKRASNVEQYYRTSPIYFLQEASDEKYEIVFGNNALGKSLVNGNVVIVEYLVCNGDTTNGAKNFSVDTINVGVNYGAVTVTTNNAALGGRYQEGIDSIKFNAPRSYQTQNRAIVDNDYQRIILEENADLQSVIAFGGEQANPQVYGKVYIAVKPYGEDFATENRKSSVRQSIIDRTPLGIDPVVIDPDYTYLIPEVTTYYDRSATRTNSAAIEDSIRTAIADFSSTNLERFGNRLRFSRFVRSLDNVTTGSILNNDVSLELQKRFSPNLDRGELIQINFNNKLRKQTISSTQFTYDGFLCYLDDDGLGNVNIYRFDSSKNKINVIAAAGSVDYDNGIVKIENFSPSAYAGIEIKVNAQPSKLDVIPVREQILIMNSSDAIITVVGETV
jgi:hypothetical protein